MFRNIVDNITNLLPSTKYIDKSNSIRIDDNEELLHYLGEPYSTQIIFANDAEKIAYIKARLESKEQIHFNVIEHAIETFGLEGLLHPINGWYLSKYDFLDNYKAVFNYVVDHVYEQDRVIINLIRMLIDKADFFKWYNFIHRLDEFSNVTDDKVYNVIKLVSEKAFDKYRKVKGEVLLNTLGEDSSGVISRNLPINQRQEIRKKMIFDSISHIGEEDIKFNIKYMMEHDALTGMYKNPKIVEHYLSLN